MVPCTRDSLRLQTLHIIYGYLVCRCCCRRVVHTFASLPWQQRYRPDLQSFPSDGQSYTRVMGGTARIWCLFSLPSAVIISTNYLLLLYFLHTFLLIQHFRLVRSLILNISSLSVFSPYFRAWMTYLIIRKWVSLLWLPLIWKFSSHMQRRETLHSFYLFCN